jgi:hypothetical protein
VTQVESRGYEREQRAHRIEGVDWMLDGWST